jgi:ATP-dependent RNA helicase RhlE
VSDVLIEEELPRYKHKIPVARARREPGEAFHEKKEKNKKVNRKITRAEAMKLKYGKPKTRGDKGKKRKK